MHAIEDKPEVEYIGGRRFPKMSPKLAHGLVQVACCAVLSRCAQAGGATSTETRFRLAPGTTLVPDVSFVSYGRLRGLSDDDIEEPPFAPDIAIEVRSKSDRASLIRKKNELYLRYGGLLVLNVDPYTRSMTVDTAQGERQIASFDRFENAAVPWLQFDAAELFEKLVLLFPHEGAKSR